MNHSGLIGNLTKDPELRYTPKGRPVIDSTLAVDRWNGKAKVTDFIPLVIWGKLAELLAEHTAKGSKIGVGGPIVTDSWEDNEGNRHYRTRVQVDTLDFAGGAKAKPKDANKTNGNKPTSEEPAPDVELTVVPS